MKKIHGGDIYGINQGMIDFSANINPLGVNQNIKNAIIKSINNINAYPDIECKKLRNAIAQNENVNPQNIICGNGAAEIIFNIVIAIKPKKVLLISPSFAEYEQAVNVINAEKIYYKLKEENNFQAEKDLIDYINDDLDMIFICNPNNPTGICIEKDFLIRIIDVCKKKNIFVLLDECFNDFLDQPQDYSIVNKIDKFQNLMILKAFTKMYAVAGVRLGYGISSNLGLIEKMYLVRQPWSVSNIAQEVGIVAINEKDIPEKTRKYIKQEREFIMQEFERLKIKYFKSKANYILFKSQAGLDEEIRNFKILIRNCENYRGLGVGFYRIAVKSHSENQKLIKALENILVR